MSPSEMLEPLRNDGRSVHHRAELEKAIAAIAARLEAVKRELLRDPEPVELGGS